MSTNSGLPENELFRICIPETATSSWNKARFGPILAVGLRRRWLRSSAPTNRWCRAGATTRTRIPSPPGEENRRRIPWPSVRGKGESKW